MFHILRVCVADASFRKLNKRIVSVTIICFVMECQMKLSRVQHELVWKRKEAIQNRFKVHIDSPCSYGDTPYDWIYKGFGQNDILIISAKGEVANVEALEKYVSDAFVNPEIIEIFPYHQDLKPIFKDTTWIEIFEEIYNVYISTKPDCELNISGAESSVSSAVSAMEELKVKYEESKDTLHVNNERSLTHRLVHSLKICRDIDISSNTFDGIPNDVIISLLSLLEKVSKEKFPVYDDLPSLEDNVLILDNPEEKADISVIVLDNPEEKADISVIVLDSDSDNGSNSKCCPENSSESSLKRKKHKKSNKARHKLKKLENKKNRRLLEGCSSQNPASHQNGRVQFPKVGSSTFRCKLPIIKNPNFIPLSLENADNDSTAEVPTEQVNQHTAEVQAQSADGQVQPAEVPEVPKRLRPVVIDGSNVAFYSSRYGRREDFSWQRIEISIQYFLNRGHTDVKVFIPQHRRALCYEKAGNQDYVENLESQQLIVFTPSRRVDGRIISCYDDRFIVDLAFRKGGVILSNDNYRDLMEENKDWAKTIKERLLMYVFAGDELMIPEDPLGPKGPRLSDFLAFPDVQ